MQHAPARLAAAEQQQGVGVCCRLLHTQLDVLHKAVGLPRHLLQQVGGWGLFKHKASPGERSDNADMRVLHVPLLPLLLCPP